MKKTLSLIGILFALTAWTYYVKTESPTLQKVASQLDGMKRVSYHYRLEINNVKDNNFSKDSSDCYFEFDQQSKLISRFKAGDKGYQQIYNGTERFTLDKTEKTYEIDDDSNQERFNSLIIMLNAIPMLKRCLDDVIANDSISKTERDTVLTGKKYKVITLGLPGKGLDYYHKFESYNPKITFFYDLIVDPATNLPYQVISHNSSEGNTYTVRTTFTHINLTPAVPQANTWYYSSYEKEYKRAKKKEAIPLIAVGSLFPAIALPQIGNKTTAPVTPTTKNKVVLLDFWIKNCGYCMESFKYLKGLQSKYGQQNVQIITVNANDSREDVDFFYKREKPAYQMFYKGQALAKKLGVDYRGYPTVILAGTDGKIVYAGNFDKEKIAQLIDKML
ncbi:TlpA disulfide reductase family protein [Mucilaginibacter sp. CSA2-8R]|uniref:TlpA family protein disulfide reductase n=1 Tax=Mucilaginibacter sp. CSA2-8R TaxID=3141542 RepID=UPI00315DBCEF